MTRTPRTVRSVQERREAVELAWLLAWHGICWQRPGLTSCPIENSTAIVGVSMTARPHGRQCWGRYTGPNWCFGHKDPLAPYPRLPCPWLLAPGIGRDWIDGKWCQCSVTVTPSDLKRLRTSREPREVWWMSSGEPPKGPGLQASCQLCEWNSTGLPRTVKEQRESDPLAPRVRPQLSSQITSVIHHLMVKGSQAPVQIFSMRHNFLVHDSWGGGTPCSDQQTTYLR